MFRILAFVLLPALVGLPLAAADLSGLVVAEHDGSAVAGAAVTLRSGGQVVAELETDDAGVFRAPGLPLADYVVVTSKTSFTTSERRVTLTDAGADLFVQITKLGVISGRVTDNQGNAIRHMVVAAVPVPSDGSPVRVYNSRPMGAATDARGRYRIFGLEAGDYYVVALAGNARGMANVINGTVLADTSHGNTAEYYPPGRSPIVLSIRSGEEHTGIDFTGYTGPLFTIHGTVSGPGPDTPYRVSLVAEDVGIPLASSTAQPGKGFQFDRVAPGTYKIVAMRQPPSPILAAIESGQLVITDANREALDRILADARASLGPDGKAPAPAFAETTVTVVSQDVAGIVLSARLGVDAKLLYQPGEGCPATVQLMLDPIEYMGSGRTGKKLEAGMELPLTGMPPASYDVSLNLPESSNCYAATSTIDFREVASDATVPIVAAPMGGILGKVDTTGAHTEDFTIALRTPDGVMQRKLPLAKDSSFSIPNVRPGRYRLSVTRRSASRVTAADQDVVVESAAAAQVDFPALP